MGKESVEYVQVYCAITATGQKIEDFQSFVGTGGCLSALRTEDGKDRPTVVLTLGVKAIKSPDAVPVRAGVEGCGLGLVLDLEMVVGCVMWGGIQ